LKTLVVFEDAAHAAFGIVAALRGVFDLRCGGRTLVERLYIDSGAQQLVLLARPELQELLRETHPGAHVGRMPPRTQVMTPGQVPALHDEVFFANGRLLALGRDLEHLFQPVGDSGSEGLAVFSRAALVGARCARGAAERLARVLQDAITGSREAGIEAELQRELPAVTRLQLESEPDRVRDGSRLLEHVWELVAKNGSAIIDDFRKGTGAGIADGALLYPGVHLLQDGAIQIAAGARLKPGVVLDAEDGPIVIEAGVVIQPNCVVRGPAWLGSASLVKAGAKLHEGTTLGPVCKVGGEIEESILQGYSNKQHEGFLGHAYLGEWVNLGADTNNSDLKNNYSTVRVWESGRFLDTGLRFLGLIAGDHVKSAINTQFNTGTVVGLSSQMFGAGFPPKFVPPFSWGGADGLEPYEYSRALEVARIVMRRRERVLSAAYERAFRKAHEASHGWSATNGG
jgi:UDP-N-acetylglucosamine diphosphorylase/glucosamine-1-phosphate N-acetyltransferase